MEHRDALALLENDHRHVEQLFVRMDTSRSVGDKALLFRDLERELEAHAQLEEAILYPLCERIPQTEELAGNAYAEHDALRQHLARAADLSPDDGQWAPAMLRLKAAVQHHVRDEEGKLFPVLRQILTPQQLERVAADIESFRRGMKLAS